jgi:hypothetical protein
MKKIISNSIIAIILSLHFNTKALTKQTEFINFPTIEFIEKENSKSLETINYMGFGIDKTFEATNGCIFHIKGEYTLLSGFVGTISIACPGESKKIYTFEFIVPSGGGTLVFVSGDAGAWNENIANDPQLQSDIATYLLGL